MAVNLSPVGGVAAQFFTNNGVPLTGGKIYTYAAGTTTPAVTYTSSNGATAHSNPIILDSGGRVPSGEIWLTDGVNYKFVLKDSNDITIATYDNISGINSNFLAFTNQQEIVTATAGQTVFNLGINYQPGTNSLSVFVDGVNQYGPGALYSYVETDSNTVTFNAGLHVGAEVKFTTTQQQGAGAVDAEQVSYQPPFTGSVATNVEAKLAQTVSVKDFGAVGDGVTDDTAAIQAAIDAALAAGQRVNAAGTFKTSSKIVIKGDADFSQAIFNVYDTPTVALEISTGNATDPTTEISRCVIWTPKQLNNMTKPGTGWVGQGIGLRVVSAFDCQIFVGGVRGFATGLLCTSFNTNGNVHNNYYLGFLQNNKVNLALTPGDSTSWVNENNFIGGHLSHESAEGTSVSGVRQILISKATLSLNNNLFVKPSIEGDVPEYHLENGGAANTLQQARWEASPPKVLYSSDNANQGVDNLIVGGYNVNQIQFTMGSTTAGYNKVLGGRSNNYDSGTSTTGIYKYMNGGSSSAPIHTFYEASAGTGRPEVAGATEWAVRHSAQQLQGKQRADSFARVTLDYSAGSLFFGDGTIAATRGISIAGTPSLVLNTPTTSGVVRNNVDNQTSLGNAAYRWSVVYAGTGTINTSDAREKQQVRSLSDAETAVAVRLKSLIKAFKFNDAVQAKGDDARIHVGVIAQEVMAAFQAEGLDPMHYAIVCYDEWDAELDDDGNEVRPAGNRYGIRYDELLAFIIGAL